MKSFLIIGAEIFGRYLAKYFHESGNDVVIVDKNEQLIESLENAFTDTFVGDCRNEDVLRSIGINNFDVCFVSIDYDFQASLEITYLLHKMGAHYIVSTATGDRQVDFLKLAGANEVIYPAKELAEKMAAKFSADNIFDYIPLTEEYAIYEVLTPADWIGQRIAEINVRRKYQINIIAIKAGENMKLLPGADYVFREDEHIVVIGKQQDVNKLTSRM